VLLNLHKRRVLQPPRRVLLGFTTYKSSCRCSFSTNTAATAVAESPSTTAKAAVDVDDLDPAAISTLPKNFGTNQHMYVNDEMKERLRSVLWEFKAPVRYAVAYGSGVFSQGTTKLSGQKPMIDLIFGVTYSQHWHSLNLQQHRDHYSFLGNLGSGVISMVQDRMGAGMYFNPYVEINGIVRAFIFGKGNTAIADHPTRRW
jgi:translocator assembly and maintenance protein 41